jgi:hypothetical protein
MNNTAIEVVQVDNHGERGDHSMQNLISRIIRGSIAAGIMAVLLPAVLAEKPGKGVLQDFEANNGTEGEYYTQVWNCTVDFDGKKVRSGSRAIKMETLENGGTVGIKLVGNQGQVDLSKAKKITLWVYDTQGDNTVELRLRDANANGGSGMDGKAIWSAEKARVNAWTKIEWNLKDYPQVDGLDKSKINSIEIYELQPGTYYYDDLQVE